VRNQQRNSQVALLNVEEKCEHFSNNVWWMGGSQSGSAWAEWPRDMPLVFA
jgi:hypothetical protein